MEWLPAGVPLPPLKAFSEAAPHPGLILAGGHPTLGLCADAGAVRAARASGSPPGAADTGAERSLGSSSRFLRASSRNRRYREAGRPGARRS